MKTKRHRGDGAVNGGSSANSNMQKRKIDVSVAKKGTRVRFPIPRLLMMALPIRVSLCQCQPIYELSPIGDALWMLQLGENG